ncbi:MAG TPA: N-acetylmuramoyl-L-alanine amidase [Phycisphaerae bacterium]|nr:N-acetylmuramoyl-L-alanine amidase [Phycisphaerae bacterium]HPS52735.1 N-acetylmuramoyl-L-alanine amidase [Phycisphaerae bacterium]
MNLARNLSVILIMAAAFAIVGCQQPAVQSEWNISPDKLCRVSEIADRLGMRLDKSTSAVARMSSPHNSVIIYGDPDGRVLVNNTEVTRSINILPDGDELLVPYKVEREIRAKLRFTGEPAAAAAKRDARIAAAHHKTYTQPTYANPPKPKWMSGSVVVVDAGHGGKDPGALGGNNTREKDVVLDIALVVAAKLRDKGHDVKLTRTGDYFIPLDGRVDMAEKAHPDLFVSIHADAAGSSAATGMTVYIPKRGDDYNMSLRAGKLVESQAGTVVSNSRGVQKHSKNLRVLERTSCPAMLIEVGFLSNPAEEQQLASSEYRRRVADSIANGIDKYLRSTGK